MINKAVIDVARTYHVLANQHFPKTVPLLAGHITDSEYQRYVMFDEEFNGVRLHTSVERPELKAKARPGSSKVDLAPFSWSLLSSVCWRAKWRSAQALKAQRE